MSNSHLQNPGKSGEVGGQIIGFKFHSNNEELQELQSEFGNSDDKNNETNLELKIKTALLSSESLDYVKSDNDKGEGINDSVKDNRKFLGRRSISVDSTYESPFSNPIETWRKLSELKVKITKTVEEKISEMKMDRNVVNKSNQNKLLNSKESSSVSDSEDTSECSRLSENWKDTEDLNLSYHKTTNDQSDLLSSILESTVENVKMVMQNIESETELKNRKNPANVSEMLSNIKIATAKSELDENSVASTTVEEVESGVEADENLDPTENDSIEIFEDENTLHLDRGNSQTPPSGGSDKYWRTLSFLSSVFLQSHTIMLIVGFGLYVFLPLPDFVKGFLLCFLLVIVWVEIKNFVQDDDSLLQQKSLIIPDYKSLPPLRVPTCKPAKGIWINEYEHEQYDPDYYSVSQTVPAYLELNDSILTLSRPKGKIHKRATFDEPDYKLNFISQRTYNISGCNIYLLPEGLTRKRLFSKKYPIVIFLKPDSFISEKKKGKEADEKESHEVVEADSKNLHPAEPPKNKSSLYLFARCDRQKEEWYRRLLAASRMSISPTHKCDKIIEKTEEKDNSDESSTKEPSTPFESLFFDDDTAQQEEYLRYMANFVNFELTHEEVKYVKSHVSRHKKLKAKKKDGHAVENEVEHLKPVAVSSIFNKQKLSKTSENLEVTDEVEQEETMNPALQVQWFNAFINRILFDLFRSPYWLSKIHEKVEKKLNSIRLPYYIENIEVIEMDLGKTGPTFHRVSQPSLDDKGLWFDMDTTFNGLIRLTIQTHLNLIKLQKGLEEEDNVTGHQDKTEKGKKKSREMKDSFLIKESKEKSKDYLAQKNKQKKVEESKSGNITPKELEGSPLERASFEESKFVDEFTELVELAVEESLSGQQDEEAKRDDNYCTCPETNCHKKLRSPIYDSDLEDSAESSDDDDEEEEDPRYAVQAHAETEEHATARRYPKNRRSSKRIFRVFENVAQSKYFKSMAQSKYIQKAIAGVSATKLRLTLEIKSCTGTLAINVPPPPSDRFWYGFREMPKLSFSANPKIGDKTLRFVHIKNYLQKKILRELKKVMVSPNMIDFVLPTSSPARSSSSLQTELPDFDDQEDTPSN